MLANLLERHEELDIHFQQLGNLSLFEMKQWDNRPNSITLKFHYYSKKGKTYLFGVSFSLTDRQMEVFLNFYFGSTFELRVISSQIVDYFLEEILPKYLPVIYLKVMQLPIRYSKMYLEKNQRIKKRKRKKE